MMEPSTDRHIPSQTDMRAPPAHGPSRCLCSALALGGTRVSTCVQLWCCVCVYMWCVCVYEWCVCVYVCMVCMYVCLQTCTYIKAYLYKYILCAYAHTQPSNIHACIAYTFIQTYKHTHIRVLSYFHTNIHEHTCIHPTHVCMYVCM